jgi:hypothetical protein
MAELTILREHLYRNHKLPEQCSRCYSFFQSHAELVKHARNLQSCEINNELPFVEGITRDQEDQLKKKGGVQGKSEIVKWKEVYRILFPNDDLSKMPSPSMYISLI